MGLRGGRYLMHHGVGGRVGVNAWTMCGRGAAGWVMPTAISRLTAPHRVVFPLPFYRLGVSVVVNWMTCGGYVNVYGGWWKGG